MAYLKIPLTRNLATEVEVGFEGFRIVTRVPTATIKFFGTDGERRLEYFHFELICQHDVESFVTLVDQLQEAVPEMRRMLKRLKREKQKKWKEV